MTKDREKVVLGVATATRLFKLQMEGETLAEATVRLGEELGITAAEAEECLGEKRKAA